MRGGYSHGMQPRDSSVRTRPAIRRGAGTAIGFVMLSAILTACPAPSNLGQIVVTATLTECPGVRPPEGENWCRTNPFVTDIVVMSGDTVVATAPTSDAGTVYIPIYPGKFTIDVADHPVYLNCDEATAIVRTGESTPVAFHCSIQYP